MALWTDERGCRCVRANGDRLQRPIASLEWSRKLRGSGPQWQITPNRAGLGMTLGFVPVV